MNGRAESQNLSLGFRIFGKVNNTKSHPELPKNLNKDLPLVVSDNTSSYCSFGTIISINGWQKHCCSWSTNDLPWSCNNWFCGKNSEGYRVLWRSSTEGYLWISLHNHSGRQQIHQCLTHSDKIKTLALIYYKLNIMSAIVTGGQLNAFFSIKLENYFLTISAQYTWADFRKNWESFITKNI